MFDLTDIDDRTPVLIFGPTACGKSGLALEIAQTRGGVIVNADALQCYQGWPILTAQPPCEDRAAAAHHLYGHLDVDTPYSVGEWLRDVAPFLEAHANGGPRPILVGGTGLYFTALTEGLAEIPATPADVRQRADGIALPDLIADLDRDTKRHIDLANRARVQRAWEVQTSTGRSIRDWQAATPPPLLPLPACIPLALRPDPVWLNERIEHRFDMMMDMGAVDEARTMCARWTPKSPASKAIGAAQMIEFVQGQCDIDTLKSAVTTATRQYAKRQRTWLRSRMKNWRQIDLPVAGPRDLST